MWNLVFDKLLEELKAIFDPLAYADDNMMLMKGNSRENRRISKNCSNNGIRLVVAEQVEYMVENKSDALES